ncbi:hypothetical protein MRB53_041477 [Persea americana]|nr:hypothetical protein MRB53_041477 [Persea americana]
MGWFWNSTSPGQGREPYSSLDPELRKFLDKESSTQHDDTTPTASGPPATSSHDQFKYQKRLGLGAPGINTTKQNALESDNQQSVPVESLYQDGRYAHLWKGYRSQTDMEQASRSDQDQLSDVIEAYNDRKAEIGRAAVENCVEYQIAVQECFSNGSWSQTFSMCKAENKAFNRCYTMQARFLKALGYLAMQRTPEEDERIQMHADKLYNEMLQREEIVKKAKEEGLEAPEFPPLIQAASTTKALGEQSAWALARQRAQDNGISTNMSAFSPEKQEEIKKQISGLSPTERELELQLLAAEGRAQMEYAEQLKLRMEEEKQHRRDRRERGKETVGDTIKRLWGWDT